MSDISDFSEIALTLSWPISFNTYYRGHGNMIIRTKSGRNCRKIIQDEVEAQCGGRPEPLLGKVKLDVVAYWPKRLSKRTWDIDNYCGKHIWDALTHAGVWGDDHQVWSCSYRKAEESTKPRLEVLISEI